MNRQRILWDGRWTGGYGIGRFGREVRSRIVLPHLQDVLVEGNPAHPASMLRFSLASGIVKPATVVSPGFVPAVGLRTRNLLTIHDLIYLDDRLSGSGKQRLFYETVVKSAILRSGSVVTVSEYSKRKISEWLGGAQIEIHVAHNGCDWKLSHMNDSRQINEEYVLLVTNNKMHKNNQLAFKAIAHLDSHVVLVTLGLTTEEVDRLTALAKIATSRVVQFRDVSDEDLQRLYRFAACVALPSLVEGFGLPALEGMALGTPTAYVCDAVHEIVGTLGFRVIGHPSPESFADAIKAAINTKNKSAASLISRAEEFNWNNTATVVEKAIEGFL